MKILIGSKAIKFWFFDFPREPKDTDYAMKVFLFKDHNVFIKATGFYSSYNGTDWDENWSNVSPKEKTITVYE